MKDFILMKYITSFDMDDKISKKDYRITPFIKKEEIESDKNFFAFKNIEGEKVSFLFKNGRLFSIPIEKKQDMDKIIKKYDLRNKLNNFFKNMAIEGFIKDNDFYVYNVVYLDTGFCPGLYETINLVSLLGMKTLKVFFTKIKLKDIIEEGLIISQLSGTDVKEKIIIKT